jgi:hypothetical protein
MVLQSIGGALFLLAEFLDLEALVPFSLGLLWAAILFAVLSLVRLGLLGRAGDAA